MTRRVNTTFSRRGDELVPNFDVVISGKDAASSNQLFSVIRPLISSIEIEDDEDMATQLTLGLINHPESVAKLPVNWRAVIDSKAFQEGNFIDVWLGYASQRVYMDRLEIVKWMPPFDSDGTLSFKIKGYDGRHRMTQENKKTKRKKKCFYQNLSDDAIVRKIADKYGYRAVTDTPTVRKKAVTKTKKVVDDFLLDDNGKPLVTKKKTTRMVYPTRIQTSDTSDWEFLKKLAEINNFDLWVEFDRIYNQHTIYFKERPLAGTADYEFNYNSGDGSLLSCTPDFSIKDQSTEVEVLMYDKTKRQISRTVISDNKTSERVSLAGANVAPNRLQATQEIGPGARVRFTAFGQVIEAFSDKPFANAKQAQQFAQRWLRERERDFLVVTGEVIGVPTLRARQIHALTGLSKRLDGFYRFTSVTHSMKPGDFYTCEFTAHKILSQAIVRSPVTRRAR